jgi:hypothetical protein
LRDLEAVDGNVREGHVAEPGKISLRF